MFIKGFDKDLKCRGMQFEIGKEYKVVNRKTPELCTDSVFHYCETLQQVHQFYSARPTENNRFCEIVPLSKEVFDNEKRGAKKIKIIREITGDELTTLRGLINGNTGIFNSGNRNSGNWNSGSGNSGSGNSGDRNSGDRNSGNRNSGNWNSGSGNSGSGNSGNWNSGDWNSGNWNSGDRNSGDRNSGNRNSGNWNSGDRNSGDRNSGNRNSGNWNSGSGNSGDFNTVVPEDILVFNRPCKKSIWERTVKPDFLFFSQMKWVDFSSMTSEEKAGYPEAEVLGGYLKKLSYKEAFQESYASLSPDEKTRQTQILKALPNFDAGVFFEISGIRID